MLDQAVKCPLTPVLTGSNNEQLFKVVRSDSLSYHTGPKIQPKFPKGSFIPWRLFSGSGSLSGAIF